MRGDSGPLKHFGVGVVKPTKKGQKPIRFKEGALRAQTGAKPGKNIPSGAMQRALSGAMGETARKRAQFKKNVLTGPKG